MEPDDSFGNWGCVQSTKVCGSRLLTKCTGDWGAWTVHKDTPGLGQSGVKDHTFFA